MPSTRTLIACLECDLLQREAPLPVGGVAHCRRCGAVLYRRTHDGLEHTFAYVLGAAVLFVLANAFPIVGLEANGDHNAATLLGAVRSLIDQDMPAVAALVFVTTLFAPAVQLAAMIHLLLPLRFGRVAPGFALVFRIVQTVRPWGMVEVFLLGVLVSLVKLADLAEVLPGIALWSFAALIVLMAAAAAAFDPHDFWAQHGLPAPGNRR